MTLWLTSADTWLVTEGQGVEFEQAFADDETPQMRYHVPAGEGFHIDVEGFKREFSGCEPEVWIEGDVEAGHVEIRDTIREGEQSLFVTHEGVTIVFQTNLKGIGGVFEFAGRDDY